MRFLTYLMEVTDNSPARRGGEGVKFMVCEANQPIRFKNFGVSL